MTTTKTKKANESTDQHHVIEDLPLLTDACLEYIRAYNDEKRASRRREALRGDAEAELRGIAEVDDKGNRRAIGVVDDEEYRLTLSDLTSFSSKKAAADLSEADELAWHEVRKCCDQVVNREKAREYALSLPPDDPRRTKILQVLEDRTGSYSRITVTRL